ncbi:MAG: hypothetical protein CV087_21205, partial [Candidatus Brocadia sp. WS118]
MYSPVPAFFAVHKYYMADKYVHPSTQKYVGDRVDIYRNNPVFYRMLTSFFIVKYLQRKLEFQGFIIKGEEKKVKQDWLFGLVGISPSILRPFVKLRGGSRRSLNPDLIAPTGRPGYPLPS